MKYGYFDEAPGFIVVEPLTGFRCWTEKPRNRVLETGSRVVDATTGVVGHKVESSWEWKGERTSARKPRGGVRYISRVYVRAVPY